MRISTLYFLLRISLLLGLMTFSRVYASHLAGGDISYRCISGNQYEITLTLYRDCSGVTMLNSQLLTIASPGCGQSFQVNIPLVSPPILITPVCNASILTTCNGGSQPGIQQYIYRGIVTLPAACSDWRFGYGICCRNPSGTLSNAQNQDFYIEARLNSQAAPCNSSPVFNSLPVYYVCVGQPFTYSQGGNDPDADSLAFSMVNALVNTQTSANYLPGRTAAQPFPSTPPITINNATGTITMTPTAVGAYVIAVRIDEYRGGVLIGSVVRDMQLLVINCGQNAPQMSQPAGVSGGTLAGPAVIRACPGAPLSFNLTGSDADPLNILTLTAGGIPGASFTTTGTNPVTGTFSWTPPPGSAGTSVLLNILLRDNACPINAQISSSILIEVIGVNAGQDRTVCSANLPVQLRASGSNSSYQWSVISGTPGSLSCTSCSNPLANPVSNTVYRVTSSTVCGLAEDTVVVSVLPAFNLNISGPQSVCGPGATATLNAVANGTGPTTYVWSPNAGLSATTGASVTATPPGNITYTVSAERNGCTVTDTIRVRVGPTLSANPGPCNTNLCASGGPVTLTANATSSSGCSDYIVSPVPFAPIPTPSSGVTTYFLSDDAVHISAVSLGFPFTFYCNTYTQCWLSSNGWISFTNPGTGAAASDATDDPIPTTTGVNNHVAICWDDLNPATGGSIQTFVTGAAPNRRFVVNFTNVPRFGGVSQTVSVQMILYESSNYIELHNVNVIQAGTTTQGIENATGTLGVAVPGRNSTSWSAFNDAWRFELIQAGPLNISWQSPLGMPVGSGNAFTVTPSGSATYYAVVSDPASGCTFISPACPVSLTTISTAPGQVIATGSTTQLSAIYNGPPPGIDCSVYTVSQIPYAPQALTAPISSIILSNEQVSAAFPLQFNFQYYCSNYNAIYVSSNGWLTFTATSNAAPIPAAIPNPALPNNLIAFAWDDLDPASGSILQYKTIGTPPNRRFVLNVGLLRHSLCVANTVICQVHLVEGSNFVEIHAQQIQRNSCNNGTMTQGIENATGTVGVTPPGRNNVLWTTSNNGQRFQPQLIGPTYSWSPANLLVNANSATPATLPLTKSQWFYVTVNNGSCTLLDSVFVQVGALDVNGISFELREEQGAALLNWADLNSTKRAFFEVEHRAENGFFSTLGRVDARNTGRPTGYRFVHHEPVSGWNYYRIAAYDGDGSVSYTDVQSLRFDPVHSLRISGMPGKARYRFEISTLREVPVQLLLYDAQGARVLQQKFLSGPSGWSFEADLSGLAAGVYLYRVAANGKTYTGKLLLQ